MSRRSSSEEDFELSDLPPEIIAQISGYLDPRSRNQLGMTSRRFEDVNNYVWYKEIKKVYFDMKYNNNVDYLKLYNELIVDDPLMTEKEIEYYFEQFSLQEFGNKDYKTNFEFDRDIYDPDYIFLFGYPMKPELFQKFIDFIESKGAFRYSYFDFYRKSNLAVQAKFGELELTPENFELVYPDLVDYNIKRLFINNDGFYVYRVTDNKERDKRKRLMYIYPQDIFYAMGLSNQDIMNNNVEYKFKNKQPLLIFLKEFGTNPKALPEEFTIDDRPYDGRFTITQKYSIALSDIPYGEKIGVYTSYRRSRHIGFTKKKLKNAILNSGLPLNEDGIPLRSLAVFQKKSKYGPRFDFLPGFTYHTSLNVGYYQTLYRYLFNTLIYVDWKSLCSEIVSQYGYNVIESIAKNDFGVNEEELDNIQTQDQLCELLQDISDERRVVLY